ncbi:TerD family protein [Streptomyces griseoviridis]|uniref:TerD domain-containing protein n=1 Tax=Streptomyces griseoviridis TaxID=45398 RepID=A0ABT9LBQ1_STRGD|nr:TerD family protein [Streptomyces griseoviridis]MDP9681145.1 hypothetical protein [Streptomyces griseoviridis]GGT20199.1 export associated protein [Streptomyces griseoviridis]
MTAELVRGQNHPLPGTRLEIRVSAGTPVVAAATLGDAEGKVLGAEWVAHPGTPALSGLEVSRQATADHRIAVDLDALPDAAHRVDVLLALPTPDATRAGRRGPARFGAAAAPFVTVTDLSGAEIAHYTLTGLDAETAVIALELYRRQGAWKVRAIGQGYAGGLAELLTDRGLPEAPSLARVIHEAAARSPARQAPTPPRPSGSEGDRTRQAVTPVLGPDPAGTPPQGAGPGPEYEAEYGDPGAKPTLQGADPGQPAPAQPLPSPPPPPARSPSRPPEGGPVDYHHPRRRTTAPAPTQPPPPAASPTPPGRPARPVAGDANGWSMDERLYNQVWGMFEDLARSVAAYRSAVAFADSRLDKELDQVLSDPRARVGGQGDTARESARARHERLVARAQEVLDRDLAQLATEAEAVEAALPPAYARWDSPVWHGYRVPVEMPMALRLGDLRLPEAGHVPIPMLVRLPLERGLWIDSGHTESPGDPSADAHGPRSLALETAVAHTARLLAAHPAGGFTVHAVDAAGSGARTLARLVRAGVLAAPPAVGARGVADVLTRLTQRVDLVHMAVRGGAADSLPPGFDTSRQLLIVHDFPRGFDDRAVNQLRYLADEGPSYGVHLMMVADREDCAGYGPLLDPLWRGLLRLTPVADDHLADPWVGHAWTYEPALVTPGSQVLARVLDRVAAARRSVGR